jgi:hypothetical protein
MRLPSAAAIVAAQALPAWIARPMGVAVTTLDPIEVTISEDALAALADTRKTAFDAELAELERRSSHRAALVGNGASAPADPAWQERVRDAVSRATQGGLAPRDAASFAAVADLQLFGRPWPYQRVNVSPGHVATVDLQNGEAHVGLGQNGSGWAAGSAEMGGPFRLPSFSDFEIRTTIDYRYDWFFATGPGSADSKGYIEIFVDELLDAPGSTWRNIVNRTFPLWEDDTGSGGSDGHTDPGNRITANERFHGRADASYVWWVGAHESVQAQFEAYSQANLYLDLSYLVFIARV